MKLHIGNLSRDITDAQLSDMITPIARPTSVEIVRDHGGVSKGYGFAEFATDDEARAVISGLDGRAIGGQSLKLGEAKPRRSGATVRP